MEREERGEEEGKEKRRIAEKRRKGRGAPRALNLCELFYDNGSTQSLTQSDKIR